MDEPEPTLVQLIDRFQVDRYMSERKARRAEDALAERLWRVYCNAVIHNGRVFEAYEEDPDGPNRRLRVRDKSLPPEASKIDAERKVDKSMRFWLDSLARRAANPS